MSARHPLPRFWLMTDERMGRFVLDAVRKLPRNSGIVFRHYSLPQDERRRLFRQVKRIARRKGHMLLLAGPDWRARSWGADGSHGKGRGSGFRSAPAHDLAELKAAERDGASLIFISPVFETRSHPGGEPLGLRGLAMLARRARAPVIALGGMNLARGRSAARHGAYGWAAIDAWTEDQNLKAVPI